MTDTSNPTVDPTGVAAPEPAAQVVAAPAPEVVSALQQRIDELEAQVNRPCAAVRAAISSWTFAKCMANAIRGVRTLLFFGVTGCLALASELNAIDISPLVQFFLPEGTTVTVGQAITLMSVAGICLRLITKTPAFWRWQGGASPSGQVDDPTTSER